jgi:hypothetical protein
MDRVLHQIGEHLSQQLPVAANGEAGGDPHREDLATILGDRSVGLRYGVEHGGQIHFGESRTSRSRLDLGDPQQRREGRQDCVGFGDRLVDGCLVFDDGARPEPGALQLLPKPGEWRAQVMGYIVGNLPQARVRRDCLR